MSILSKFKATIILMLVKFLGNRHYFKRQFFLHSRQALINDLFQYPSIINNGYLHIERVFSLARKLGIANNKTIIDVGAAGGLISKMFSENAPEAKVYSFEPVKTTYEELLKNTSGYKNIHPVNKGLGAFPVTANIHVLQRITSSSILVSSNSIDDPYLAESLKEKNTEEIIISTLDIEIPSMEMVGIIKMDVQGYELEVLKGATETLKRTDMIVVELQNHSYYQDAPQYFEIDAYLRNSGFVFFDIVPSIRENEKLIEFDSIYVSEMLINKVKHEA